MPPAGSRRKAIQEHQAPGLRQLPVMALPQSPAPVAIIAEDGNVLVPTFLGAPFRDDPHLEDEVRRRSEINYGADIASPFGRRDRLFQIASDRTAQATEDLYLACKRDEPSINWAMVGATSIRENPGQGLQSAPDQGIKNEPDEEDWQLAGSFWDFMSTAPPEASEEYPVLSIPRVSAMGFPFMSREEAARIEVIHSLPAYCEPYYGGLEAAVKRLRKGATPRVARAAYADAVRTPVFGVRFACTTLALKGMRAQPGKFEYVPGYGFRTLKPDKKTRTYRGDLVPVTQEFGSNPVRGRARVRRVLGKPVTWNTSVSLQRRRATGPLYYLFNVLPSQQAEQELLERCLIYGPGVQYDGDGTDGYCPPFLPCIYAYAAADRGNSAGAAMCALTALGNMSAAAQSSNVWQDPGVSGYGQADQLTSPVYMGFQSGLDTVAPFTVISSGHAFGRTLLIKEVRKRYSTASWNVQHRKLPTATEFWPWLATCMRRKLPEPGLPAVVWCGDGIRLHAYTDDEYAFWEWVLTAGPHNVAAHLKFAEDKNVETHGATFTRGDLRAYLPKRIAYFLTADALRTSRKFLGLGLVALAQNIVAWGRKAPRVYFDHLIREGTRGDIRDFERFAYEYAQLDAAELSLLSSYEDTLVILKPDRLDWMPEEFLARVSATLLEERRTYLTLDEARPLYDAASKWASMIVDGLPELFQLANQFS